MSELIMNKNKEENIIQICVLEDNDIKELYVHSDEKESIIGNIYSGIVQNVVDGMGAAFVDIGMKKNTFISIKDALPKVDVAKEELVINKKMSEVLKKGDKLLVQVRKEPTEEKGARVSTHITLPGNYVVLMPNTNIITISQKIEDKEEIERLKNIVKRELPQNFGVIIRTDACNIPDDTIENDIKEVLEKWYEIEKNYKQEQNKGLVYNDHDIVLKTARDMLTLSTVCSKLLSPVYFPEFTSIAVKASVLSIAIYPPHSSHIFLFSVSFSFVKSPNFLNILSSSINSTF